MDRLQLPRLIGWRDTWAVLALIVGASMMLIVFAALYTRKQGKGEAMPSHSNGNCPLRNSCGRGFMSRAKQAIGGFWVAL